MTWRLDHVQLAIPPGSEERCDEFYVDVLGFAREEKPAALATRGGRWYRQGDVSLHLGVALDFQPATKAHPAFRVGAYATLVERVEAAGYHVRVDQAIEGMVHCYVDDPVGNRLELIDASVPDRR
ncbi:MAG: glyoxalase [Acidobacteriota bacterium]|nr:glyoxalase [Acidobacteriota bacterium]